MTEITSKPVMPVVATSLSPSSQEGSRNLTIVNPSPKTPPSTSTGRGWRFWAMLAPLLIAVLLTSLEATIPTASMPAIAAELDAGDNWVWVINGYLLTSTVSIPLYGQSAFVLGRRWPTLFSVAMFILGSGLSGSATSIGMLIGGRVVQGLGGGGINVLSTIVISDLTTVRERGKYLAILLAIIGVGIAIGPPLGGIIAQRNWRWVFWLNLPVGGLAFVMMAVLLHLNTRPVLSIRQGLKRIDWIGNGLLVASVVSILIAFTWADARYPFTSWRILTPLLVGIGGLCVFHTYEASRFCANPTIPPRLFSNRTAAVSFALTFWLGVVTNWRIYFITIYFEGVLLASPLRAGVLLLPAVLVYVPASVSGGIALSKWGRYKIIHLVACALIVLASGLYLDFDRNSSLAKVVLYQMISGWGSGMLVTTTLPAAQASLGPEDAVAASSLWGYLRMFGNIWGIALPAVIFNSRFAADSGSISDETVRATLGGGDAYSHVSGEYISSLPVAVRDEVIQVYTAALNVAWLVCLVLSCIVLLIAFLEREVVMRTTLDEPQSDQSGKAKTDLESSGGGESPGEPKVVNCKE